MKTKPRILFLAPHMERGEISDYVIDLIHYLQQEKKVFSAVISAGGYETLRLRRYGVPHIQAPIYSYNPFSILSSLKQMKQVIEKYKINVIHTHSRVSSFLASLVAKKYGLKIVSTMHYPHGLENKKPSWIQKQFNRGFIQSDALITSFSYIKNIALQFPDIQNKNVHHIPRWVDTKYFESESISPERLIALTKKWNIPDGIPLILNISEESEANDIFFLEALANLPYRQFCVLLVRNWAQGYTPLRGRIEKKAKELNVYRNLSIVLPEDDEPLMYKMSDLLICPSTISFARIALQAQIMGRPIILPAVKGASDFVETNESGYLFLPNNTESLTNALNWGLNLNDSKREVLVKKAHRFALQYEKNTILSQIFNIYNTLLSN